MTDLDDFQEVFGYEDAHFPHSLYEEIRSNRKTLDNELFFDRLLRLLNIPKGSFSSMYIAQRTG
jgi:hypothetical protein